MVRDGGSYVVDVPRSQINTLIILANSCSLRSSTVFLLILRLKSKQIFRVFIFEKDVVCFIVELVV